jgi:hypothetical protein
MAEAMNSADNSAMKSPNRLPVPIESHTMMATPTIITAIVISVALPGVRQKNPRQDGGEHAVLKARMKTRLAVEVL